MGSCADERPDKVKALNQCKPLRDMCGCCVVLAAKDFLGTQCDAVNGLSVTETWTLRASLLSYIMALTATIGERAPPVNLQRTLRLHSTTNPCEPCLSR